MLDEAIELRKYGVTIPILVLSYTDPRRAEEIIEYHITQTVYSNELAMSLSIAGQKAGREVRIHIKVDTGMGRVDYMAGFEAVKNIKEIQSILNIYRRWLDKFTIGSLLLFVNHRRFCI